MLVDNLAIVVLFANDLSLTFFNHFLYDFFCGVVDWKYQCLVIHLQVNHMLQQARISFAFQMAKSWRC